MELRTKDCGTVIGDWPGLNVCLPMTYPDLLFAVKTWEPIVNGGSKNLEGVMAIVLLPMTICAPDGARLTGVPDIINGGAPGRSTWLPTMYCDATTVIKGGPFIARLGLLAGEDEATIFPATIRAFLVGAKGNGVP